MTRMAKQVALAVLLAIAAAYAYAQVPLPSDWPAKHRDAANTSSTPVLPPDTLKPDWQIPTEAMENPRVYLTSSGDGQILISGNNIYRASDGTWLRSLPYTARYGIAAITTTTIVEDGVEVLVDVLLNGDGSQFHAYNLHRLLNDNPDDDQPMWSLEIPVDPERDSSQERCWNPTARNGVFYLATYADGRIFRVDAASGLFSERDTGAWFNDGPPAVATIKDDTGEEEEKELVFLTGSGCGLLALDANTLETVWSRGDIDSRLAQSCVDEAAGIVYVHNAFYVDTWIDALEAYDAFNGDFLWSAPLDHILNKPPTLGWAKDQGGNLHAAVFAVTGGMDGVAGVYAFRRDNGEELWSTTIPSDAWVAAVYCGCTGPEDLRGGRLYIATNNRGADSGYPEHGDTYVLDAFTGERLQVLGTDSYAPFDNACPVIVDVGGTPYMYVLTEAGKIVAWKQDGQLPPPPVYELSIQASPGQISTNASATVTVTFVDAASNGTPVVAETIHFSSNAAKNQGYVNPTEDVTDSSGTATTTFYSQSRTGVVTVTARTPDGTFANTTITITKGGGEEPPASGSIQGTVYYAANDKPAKKVPVELYAAPWDPLADPVAVTTTNPRGKYSFQEVPFGAYIVFASSNGATGMTDVVEISQSSPSVTSPEGDVQLVDPAP